MIIYKITNLVNQKIYVGQTVTTIEKRFKRHYEKYSENSKYCSAIFLALKKYGKENFSVEEIDRANSIDELNEKESFWIIKLNSVSPNGYNLNYGGGNKRHSQETKDKISKSNKGKLISQETKDKQSKSHLGHKVSDETKRKLSLHNKGRKPHKKTIIALVKKLSKTYKLVNPFGEEIDIYNLAEFCRKNKLSNSKMCLVVNGKRNHHKGWRIKRKYNETR